ncbi:MAG: phosphoesterase RecJ domain-containing protein [Clostridiales bacterium]|jgi:phosphoesterase RecJ-like protein|nr:phosphoesterase RecJ domain-containing protein [Clostridiales bacterium]
MGNEVEKLNRKQAAHRLTLLDDVLIYTHRRPDGDTVGCAAALCLALRSIGKTAYIFENNDNIDRLLPYLDGLLQPAGFIPGSYVSVDIATPRLFPYGHEDAAQTVDLVLDHHPSNASFGKAMCVDPECAACGELIYDILLELGCVNKETALPLYLAIASDTGCFRYSNTTAHTHEVASKLISLNIDFAAVNHRMFETKTRSRLKLEAMLTETAEYYDGGTAAVAILTNEMARKAGATADDEDDIASLIRSVEGVLAAVTIREQPDGSSKVSVRTVEEKDSVSAAEVCAVFGGGGHLRAGGCNIDAPPGEAAKMVLEAIRRVREYDQRRYSH